MNILKKMQDSMDMLRKEKYLEIARKISKCQWYEGLKTTTIQNRKSRLVFTGYENYILVECVVNDNPLYKNGRTAYALDAIRVYVDNDKIIAALFKNGITLLAHIDPLTFDAFVDVDEDSKYLAGSKSS